MTNYAKPPATDVDLRALGRNICQAVRECPASQYLVCGCLDSGKNCWDITGKPCCKRDEFDRCLSCEIYLEAVRQIGSEQDG